MGRLLTGLCVFAVALATISCGNNQPAETAKRNAPKLSEHDVYDHWVGGAWFYMDRQGRIVRRYCKDLEGSPY